MAGVRLPLHYSIVVRKSVVTSRDLTRETLLHIVSTSQPFDEDDNFIVFGPFADREAQSVVIGRLETYGLRVNEDFIYLTFPLPVWLLLTATLGEYEV